MYVNKIENQNQESKSRIKIRSFLETSTSEASKLLGGTRNKITKDESGKNAAHSEMTEAMLAYCSIVSNDYQQDLRGFYTFNKLFGHLLDISTEISYFKNL